MTPEQLIGKLTNRISLRKKDAQLNKKLRANINLINKLSLQIYARSSHDIKRCPNKGCNFIGFIEEDELKYCVKALKCELCQTEWRDQTQGRYEPFKVLRHNLTTLLTTKKCPNKKCGVLIKKDGGCDHMRCAKCQLEFCWVCMGRFVRYRHDSEMDTMLCNASHLVWVFITVLVAFVVPLRIMTLPHVLTSLVFVFQLITIPIVWCWKYFVLLIFCGAFQIILALFTVCVSAIGFSNRGYA